MNKQPNENKKTSPAGAIVAAICIGIYLFALIQGAVRIYFSIEEQKFTADREFENIVSRASFAGNLGFMNETFIEAMNNALSQNRTIEAMIISGPEGEYAFERQRGAAITWVNNSPRFVKRIDYSGQNLYKPLSIQGLRNTNIQAVALAFNYEKLTTILKETLFLVLIGFLLAFFALLLGSLTKASGSAKTAASYQQQKQEYKPVPIINAKEEKKSKAESSLTSAHTSTLASEITSAQADDDIDFDSIVPNGLFSPRTNIGWEEYTKDRLESELHRCSSSEKDLVLIMMEFAAILDENEFKKAADEAVTFFASRDLMFEKGNQGISVICPGIDLETGLSKSQQYQERILGKFSDPDNTHSRLCIGLSSRSGRLLNSSRLLMEASEALNKAQKDKDSTIIAFKSDLEKYRNYIQKHG